MIYHILFYLLIYSFLGWISEVIYAYFVHKKYINRGFLYGPFCPIYGIGMVIVLLIVREIENKFYLHSFLSTFFILVFVATLLELFTGWILEVLFHTKWWDYSDKKFNVKGYVCLTYSIMWGIGGTVLFTFVHPFVSKLMLTIHRDIGVVILFLTYSYLLIDVFFTLKELLVFKNIVKQMHLISEQIYMDISLAIDEVELKRDHINEQISKNLFAFIKEMNENKDQLHVTVQEKFNQYILDSKVHSLTSGFKSELERIKQRNIVLFENNNSRYYELKKKIMKSHLTKSFPKLSSKKYKKVFKDMKRDRRP